MENTKIDLERMNEQDWERYRKMRKVAQRRKTSWESVVFSCMILIALGAIVFLLIYQPLQGLGKLTLLANYTLNQFNASVHSSNIIPISHSISTTSVTLSNAIINKTITVIASNPKASSAFAVATYLSLQMLALLLIVVMGSLLFIYFLAVISQDSAIELPRTYRTLCRYRSRIKERDENLRKYGFTENEIAWYHAVRAELIKQTVEYNM